MFDVQGDEYQGMHIWLVYLYVSYATLRNCTLLGCTHLGRRYRRSVRPAPCSLKKNCSRLHAARELANVIVIIRITAAFCVVFVGGSCHHGTAG